ncbi:hypothetical protein EDD29_2606 [Actinocorallia herbida]|uniref:Uncharacterized protein n=1 Tax=Actinocorallia herbida TaxID=58109 RepID=A0A3N1CUT7_9ACTN|nr:hypothetical protein [Actinocorallia herbida]ROO85071.1 hypothetical protein EDD29_2606 [Actinocorallia herbida]
MLALLTVICCCALAVAGATGYAQVRAGRRRLAALRTGQNRSVWVYLDEDGAIDLYRQGDYPYLQRTVERTTRRTIASRLRLRSAPLSGGADHVAGEQLVTRYFEDAGAVTAIGRIVRALDAAHDIIYVDLINQRVLPNAGLDRALEPAYGDRAGRVGSVRLRELEPAFVSVEGRFRIIAETDTTVTFAAPYGDPGTLAEDAPVVSVTCPAADVRLPSGPPAPFRARCLGKISWNPSAGTLEISPLLAIYR